jgi:hypothetical protein
MTPFARKVFRIIAYIYLTAIAIFLSLHSQMGNTNWLELIVPVIYIVCLSIRIKIIDRIIGMLSATFTAFFLISLHKDLHAFEILIFSLAFIASLMIYVYRSEKKKNVPPPPVGGGREGAST